MTEERKLITNGQEKRFKIDRHRRLRVNFESFVKGLCCSYDVDERYSSLGVSRPIGDCRVRRHPLHAAHGGRVTSGGNAACGQPGAATGPRTDFASCTGIE